ncbi:MAG: DUF642 domain-containing protein [Verrucomicrobia bacterium]|nr:DUF642 domain-containing protein [Verrucomicrobiota bacterium]
MKTPEIIKNLGAAIVRSALALVVSPLSAVELIQNGSFETGTPPGNGSHENVASSNVTGWSTGGSGGIVWYMTSSNWGGGGPAGGDALLVNVNGNMTLSQSFSVDAGTEYTVSYYEKRRGNGGYMDATLDVAAGTYSVFGGGTPVAVTASSATSIVQTTAANAAWTLHSFTFKPNTTTTATLSFKNVYGGGRGGDNDGVFVDLVSVTEGGLGLTPTTTALARSSGTVTPSTYADPLSFDVTVDPGTATGSITLKDGGTTIGTGVLVSGACTITPASPLAVGTHANIVASYEGDSTYAGSVSSALDPAQVVTAGAPVELAFTTQPGGGQPGAALDPQPVVTVRDAFGNTVTGSSASITLVIKSGTPTSGGPGTLGGTTTVSAVNGIATFTDLSIDLEGEAYQLTATSSGLASADSNAFSVVANLITNGSFETGTPPTGGSHENLAGSNVTGWTAGGNNGIVWYMTSSNWGGGGPSGGGARLVNVNGNTTVFQSLAVTAGTEYTVSYHERQRGGGGYMDTTLSVADGTVTGADGTPLAVSAGPATSVVQTTAANASWTLHSFKFTPSSTTTATLTFGNHYTAGVEGDNDGVYVDLVRVAASGGGGGSYATWAASNGFDPDHPEAVGNDGLTNLMIYALNLNTDGTNGSPGTLSGNLISFSKRAEAVTNGDVAYLIEESDDLGLTDPWTEVSTYDTNDNSIISYSLPTGKPASYARLRVTKP